MRGGRSPGWGGIPLPQISRGPASVGRGTLVSPLNFSMKQWRFPMKRILAFAIMAMLLTATVVAAKNSQTFYLATTARAGNVELPRGIYEVTWSTPSKSRVTLTIKAEDEKTFKVLARVVEGKQDRTGVVTSVVEGVSYLQELHTNNAKFILQSGIEVAK